MSESPWSPQFEEDSGSFTLALDRAGEQVKVVYDASDGTVTVSANGKLLKKYEMEPPRRLVPHLF